MKTLSIVTVAILLGLSGAAMAGGDSESQQGSTNATGPNPYMTFSGGPTFSGYRAGGYGAFASYPAQHHVVNRHIEK